KMTTIHLSTPEKFWNALLQVIERTDLAQDERFCSPSNRRRNYKILREILTPIFLMRPRDEWQDLFDKFDVPYAPVNGFEDLEADPQMRHLGTFFEIEDGNARQRCLARPVLFDGQRDFATRRAPRLGEHTREILDWLGYSPEQ